MSQFSDPCPADSTKPPTSPLENLREDPDFCVFSNWMDAELTDLEDRFRAFWTPHSVISVLLAATLTLR